MVWVCKSRSVKSLEKPLLLGKIEGKRRRERQRMRWLESITDSMDMNLSKLQGIVEDRGSWHAAVHGVLRSQRRPRDWTNHWKCFLCNTTRWRKVLTYFELIHPSLLEKTFEIPLDCKGRRQWHPTPVLLPGKSHGRRSLVGCSPWGR